MEGTAADVRDDHHHFHRETVSSRITATTVAKQGQSDRILLRPDDGILSHSISAEPLESDDIQYWCW